MHEKTGEEHEENRKFHPRACGDAGYVSIRREKPVRMHAFRPI